MTSSEHPGRETLWRFGLGRLDRRGMVAVEGHLRQCPQCGRIALRAPDDRLVTLLRAPSTGLVAEPSPDDMASPPRRRPELPRKSSAKKPSRTAGMIVLLLCLSAVLGPSILGCSGGGGAATLSPADQAKAKEAFQKRYAGGDEKQNHRKASP